jgi:hypothetical protein
MSSDILRISCKGITAVADTVLWQATKYDSIFSFLNYYGSESQIRGIFASITSGDPLIVEDLSGKRSIRKNYPSSMKLKSWRFGYGKYQAALRDDNILSECVIDLNNSPVDAWDLFLKKRRIPYLKEWIPSIMRLLEKEGLATPLSGYGKLKAWRWTATDDEACDLIVKKIFKKAVAA